MPELGHGAPTLEEQTIGYLHHRALSQLLTSIKRGVSKLIATTRPFTPGFVDGVHQPKR